MPSVEMLARIKELETANERLKAELNEPFFEHEKRLMDEIERLKAENTKLKCLALHLFWKYAEVLMWKCDGMSKCAPTPLTKDRYLRKCLIWEDVRLKCYKAYRKARESLKNDKSKEARDKISKSMKAKAKKALREGK